MGSKVTGHMLYQCTVKSWLSKTACMFLVPRLDDPVPTMWQGLLLKKKKLCGKATRATYRQGTNILDHQNNIFTNFWYLRGEKMVVNYAWPAVRESIYWIRTHHPLPRNDDIQAFLKSNRHCSPWQEQIPMPIWIGWTYHRNAASKFNLHLSPLFLKS